MTRQPKLESPDLLGDTLRAVARRYRLPAIADAFPPKQATSPATAIALSIEYARRALDRGDTPDAEAQRIFIDALARLIRDAMREDSGDAALQAMVLRHREPRVREYASLSAHADQDRRQIQMDVDAIAHPGKLQRLVAGPQRDALAQLHAAASGPSWSALHDTARRLLGQPAFANETALQRVLSRLLDHPALERLLRLEALTSDERVRRYVSLWERHGPRSGSAMAAAQGDASKRRGAAAEASAAQALEALAQRLNEADGTRATYRVVTSMRVPASFPASAERAKSEWDVVLLKHPNEIDDEALWDVCLLVEVKASVDAATTDFSRLLKGLRLLARADTADTYSFDTRQGAVRLRGASLGALATDEASLERTVLYCCEAPADMSPRLLSAASRMQLLSAQASLDFAGALPDTHHDDSRVLEPLWHELLESPRWNAVLNQYPMMREVRELIVHTPDLLAAVNTSAENIRR